MVKLTNNSHVQSQADVCLITRGSPQLLSRCQDTWADCGLRPDDFGRHWLDLLLGPPRDCWDSGFIQRFMVEDPWIQCWDTLGCYCLYMFWSDAWVRLQDDTCFRLDLNVAGCCWYRFHLPWDWRVTPLRFRVDTAHMSEYQSCLLSFQNDQNVLHTLR